MKNVKDLYETPERTALKYKVHYNIKSCGPWPTYQPSTYQTRNITQKVCPLDQETIQSQRKLKATARLTELQETIGMGK